MFAVASRTRATTWSTSPPERTAAAPVSRMNPSAPHALRESMTSMRRSGCALISSSAAWRADSTVPEIPPEMWMETMSLPASASGL